MLTSCDLIARDFLGNRERNNTKPMTFRYLSEKYSKKNWNLITDALYKSSG